MAVYAHILMLKEIFAFNQELESCEECQLLVSSGLHEHKSWSYLSTVLKTKAIEEYLLATVPAWILYKSYEAERRVWEGYEYKMRRASTDFCRSACIEPTTSSDSPDAAIMHIRGGFQQRSSIKSGMERDYFNTDHHATHRPTLEIIDMRDEESVVGLTHVQYDRRRPGLWHSRLWGPFTLRRSIALLVVVTVVVLVLLIRPNSIEEYPPSDSDIIPGGPAFHLRDGGMEE